MKVGLLGGTFDPPHHAHLSAARAVRDLFSLDRVDLVPACRPPHKPGRPLSSPFHRFAMTVLAASGETRISASLLELERGGLSYAIETLREARRAFPESRIFFILGTDQFAEIGSWREPEAIVGEFDLIVVGRPGVSFEEAVRIAPPFVGAASSAGRIHEAALEPIDLSSTSIRTRVRGGMSIAGLVAPPVEEYIHQYGLYRQPDPTMNPSAQGG